MLILYMTLISSSVYVNSKVKISLLISILQIHKFHNFPN